MPRAKIDDKGTLAIVPLVFWIRILLPEAKTLSCRIVLFEASLFFVTLLTYREDLLLLEGLPLSHVSVWMILEVSFFTADTVLWIIFFSISTLLFGAGTMVMLFHKSYFA